MMNFYDWINEIYVEWRGDSRRTITEFAKYLGFSQQVVSSWMNQKGKVPSTKSIIKLASKYPEVYDIFGIQKPKSESEPWDQLPPDLRKRLKTAFNEINAVYFERGIKPEDDEAISVASEILEKYGFTVDDIE